MKLGHFTLLSGDTMKLLPCINKKVDMILRIHLILYRTMEKPFEGKGLLSKILVNGIKFAQIKKKINLIENGFLYVKGIK